MHIVLSLKGYVHMIIYLKLLYKLKKKIWCAIPTRHLLLFFLSLYLYRCIRFIVFRPPRPKIGPPNLDIHQFSHNERLMHSKRHLKRLPKLYVICNTLLYCNTTFVMKSLRFLHFVKSRYFLYNSFPHITLKVIYI